MTSNEIEQLITRSAGINSLNEMQIEMLKSHEKFITLIAPTGSGKTLAFTIRLLKNLNSPGRTQAIVIAPSRELVMQIYSVIRPIAKGYKTVAFYGGHSMLDERNSLSPSPDIIIATPGRLLDHLHRGNLTIKRLDTMILDEYDKTLELGFEKEMKQIISRIVLVKCLIMTSATEITPLPNYLPLDSPHVIDMRNENNPRKRMDTIKVPSFSRDKLDSLVNLLGKIGILERTIVFVNHRESAERVAGRLKKEQFPVILYHGALDQQQRAMAIDLFANGTAPIMVATDLAARGLDISNVNNIIHYHLPLDVQTWTHRNGRTARIDKSGTVWVIMSESDNHPDYIEFDREYIPDNTCSEKISGPQLATLYFNAGKKEKISRGDIAGFISASGVTSSDEIGKISVHDHYSIAAVPADKINATAKALNELKLKGKKTKVSIVKV